MLNTTAMEDFKNHAEAQYPLECCGVIVQNMQGYHYVPCTNVSDKPYEEFIISAASYLDAEKVGTVVAIAHSHPNGPQGPSQYDIASCSRGNVPWVILSYPNLSLSTIYPQDRSDVPYVGRSFIFGVSDCYSLIQDYYKRELGIELFDYYREDEFWLQGKNYYLDRFKEQNFVEVSGPAQPHDLLLIKLKANVPNHGAIVVSEDKILHHVSGRLSKYEMYSSTWKKLTHTIIRHRSLM